ncbi:MAG TPA: hypothetical protein VGM23_09700 [Armatimonadota bacterium]|jgi:hypothetical protein
MIKLSLCLVCKHFHYLPSYTCDAFPEGIPDEVFYREIEHRQPIPGDHGIQFEKMTLAELNAIGTQRIAEGVDHEALVEGRKRLEEKRARQKGRA